MSHWKDLVDVPILEVSYEELVADQDAQSRRLVKHHDYDFRDNLTEVKYLVAGTQIGDVTTNIFDARDRLVAGV